MKFYITFGLSVLIMFGATPRIFSSTATPSLSWILQNPFISNNFSSQENVTSLEQELISLYNDFSTNNNFDITCQKTTSNGSFFFTYCQPFFIEEAIRRNRTAWREGTATLKKTAEIFEIFVVEMQTVDKIFGVLLEGNERARTLNEEIFRIRNQAQKMRSE